MGGAIHPAYRVRCDIQTWFSDPAILELIKTEYKRGYYRGVGEFHIYGNDAAGPLVKATVDFAVEHDLYLHAHCDEPALLASVRAQPASKNHLGAYRLYDGAGARAGASGKISGAVGRACPTAAASPTDRASSAMNGASCSLRHSDRFLIGSDTWINERWFEL